MPKQKPTPPTKFTLTDLLYPGKNANPRQAYLLGQQQAGKLSPQSREFAGLVKVGWITRDGTITRAGKDVLKTHVTKE